MIEKTNIQGFEVGGNKIVKVVINVLLPEQFTIVCDFYDENDLLCNKDAGLWYEGENKNIPFDFDPSEFESIEVTEYSDGVSEVNE